MNIAQAFEQLYGADVAARFDASGNKFIYYDAGNVKINATDGPVFMVAAWNGNGFDLSTGFMPAGGPASSYQRPIGQNQNLWDL